MDNSQPWPSLPWDAWKDTCDTLHMWMQVVGKVKLELSPFLNELWHVAFHLTARGMTTGLIPSGDRSFEVRFDFIDHNLFVETSDGRVKAMPLLPRSVASFHEEFMSVLHTLGIDANISLVPVETDITIPYDQDRTHMSYDAGFVRDWWHILMGTESVLQRYRSFYVGKSSPILFYWGSFDLTQARFSGRPAPSLEGAPRFFQIAEDQENVACGFWPGNANASGFTLGEPAFYSYINPAPEGYRDASVASGDAYFHEQLGEFILPYDAMRRAASPEQTLLEFLQSAYEAAANLAHWDRSTLERTPFEPDEIRGARRAPAATAKS